MHNLWKEMGIFQITEQRLLDQKAQIMRKKWLTEEEERRKNILAWHLEQRGKAQERCGMA